MTDDDELRLRAEILEAELRLHERALGGGCSPACLGLLLVPVALALIVGVVLLLNALGLIR